MSKIPDRGDLVWINLNPRSGHEQAGHRPALVISPKIYHMKSKLTLVCPITSNKKPWPWKVFLPEDCIIQGAVLADQLRSIDREARKLELIGSVPKNIVLDVIAKISVLID